MECHRIEPEAFLHFVHDIDVSVIDPDHALSDALDRLEGRKLVFTNGSHAHAENVLGQVGIRHHFDQVFDIVDADYIPKPERQAYDMFIAMRDVDATKAAMFEDIARNLHPPHAMGMTTVLVHSPDNESARFIDDQAGSGNDHVHHVTDDLAAFLEGI